MKPLSTGLRVLRGYGYSPKVLEKYLRTYRLTSDSTRTYIPVDTVDTVESSLQSRGYTSTSFKRACRPVDDPTTQVCAGGYKLRPLALSIFFSLLTRARLIVIYNIYINNVTSSEALVFARIVCQCGLPGPQGATLHENLVSNQRFRYANFLTTLALLSTMDLSV